MSHTINITEMLTGVSRTCLYTYRNDSDQRVNLCRLIIICSFHYIYISHARPLGRVISATDFESQGDRFESLWRRFVAQSPSLSSPIVFIMSEILLKRA